MNEKEHKRMVKISEARALIANAASDINKKLGGLTPMEWLDVMAGKDGLVNFYIECGLGKRK